VLSRSGIVEPIALQENGLKRYKTVALEVGLELIPVRTLSPGWAKGRARVQNGELVLDEGRAVDYIFHSPEESERMAFDLAALSSHIGDETAAEKEAVSFAGRWGLLWHGADDLGSGKCRESLQDWLIEAERLNEAGVLYQSILASKRDGSAEAIQNFLRRRGLGFPSLSPGSEHFDQNYIYAASHMLQSMINEGLTAGPTEVAQARTRRRRCWWGLSAVGPGEFQLTQYPPDLLSRAYSAFGVLIANTVETRSCRVCGKLFRPKPRQGDCCSESCSSTHRGRRRRERLKQMLDE